MYKVNLIIQASGNPERPKSRKIDKSVLRLTTLKMPFLRRPLPLRRRLRRVIS
jgi:hypothetical protein